MAEKIGDFWVYLQDNAIRVYLNDPENSWPTVGPLPSLEEANTVLGTSCEMFSLNSCLRSRKLVAPPRIAQVKCEDAHDLCSRCESLHVAPKLPQAKNFNAAFQYASVLIPPVIPKTAENCGSMFNNTPNLRCLASVPAGVKRITLMYAGSSAGGEMVIRPTSFDFMGSVLKNTTNTIVIYGDKSICESVVATANNGNASWQPWYEPVPAVTNRGQGSRTTAEDMTRMVRNGVLAVDSYAPGRMRYEKGDIVREDEWEALVEAAQTIDPTITMSTHYTNLNKIEKAFDDAL